MSISLSTSKHMGRRIPLSGDRVDVLFPVPPAKYMDITKNKYKETPKDREKADQLATSGPKKSHDDEVPEIPFCLKYLRLKKPATQKHGKRELTGMAGRGGRGGSSLARQKILDNCSTPAKPTKHQQRPAEKLRFQPSNITQTHQGDVSESE